MSIHIIPSQVLLPAFLAYSPLILTLSLLSIPLCTIAHKTSPPTKNVTLTVPITLNITDHGDHHLLCTPTRWTDVASFFLGNFVAHAATVKTLPGEPALLAFAGKIYALLFPTSGLVRGLKGIYQHAITCKMSLEIASKAGALCTVVRLPNWEPRTGDAVRKSWVAQREERRNGELEEVVGPSDGALHGVNIELENNSENHAGAHHEPPAVRATLTPLLDSHGSIPITWEFSAFRPKGEQASFLPSTDISSIRGRKIHGTCCLPPGYALRLLPPGTHITSFDASGVPGRQPLPPPSKKLKNAYAVLQRVCSLRRIGRKFRRLDVRRPDRASNRSSWWRRLGATLLRWVYSGLYSLERRLPHHCFPTRDPDKDFFVSNEISSTYSFSKALVAIIQVIFASVTLYRARGDQIQRYGYAAFGLTVAPYLIMSMVNLVSTVLTPDFPALYLVSSEIMREAVRRGGRFEGVVRELREGEEEEEGAEGKLEFEV